MKNFDLNYEGFEQYMIERINSKEGMAKGVKYEFHFENGYGASIIKHELVRGYEDDLWEIWMLKKSNDKWKIDLKTPLIEPIVYYLTEEDVRNYLQQIKEL